MAKKSFSLLFPSFSSPNVIILIPLAINKMNTQPWLKFKTLLFDKWLCLTVLSFSHQSSVKSDCIVSERRGKDHQ